MARRKLDPWDDTIPEPEPTAPQTAGAGVSGRTYRTTQLGYEYILVDDPELKRHLVQAGFTLIKLPEGAEWLFKKE
ncbi:MAG: hypothetical protein AB1374_04870 [Bacillota bacterium]